MVDSVDGTVSDRHSKNEEWTGKLMGDNVVEDNLYQNYHQFPILLLDKRVKKSNIFTVEIIWT